MPRWGDKYCLVVEPEQQVFCPAVDRDDAPAAQPLGEPRRKRDAQIGPPEIDRPDDVTGDHRAETAADGFDFGQFRHG